jgi:hypothetical protein
MVVLGTAQAMRAGAASRTATGAMGKAGRGLIEVLGHLHR